MSPDAMLRLANLLEEAATALRLSATVIKDLEPKIVAPRTVPVSDFMSVRVRKALRKLNVTDLAELEQISADQVMMCKNVGETTLGEIRGVMAMRGLYLRGEKP